MGRWGTGKLSKVCRLCHKQFLARHDRLGKFCSKSCAIKSRPPKKFHIQCICKNCSVPYFVKKYRKKITRFCSRKCLSIIRGFEMQKEKHPNWKGGISERNFSDRKIIEQKKKEIGKCEICNMTQNLEGHHVNGYEKDRQTIQILCHICHAKQHLKYKNFIRKKYERKKAMD